MIFNLNKVYDFSFPFELKESSKIHSNSVNSSIYLKSDIICRQ